MFANFNKLKMSGNLIQEKGYKYEIKELRKNAMLNLNFQCELKIL